MFVSFYEKSLIVEQNNKHLFNILFWPYTLSEDQYPETLALHLEIITE